MRISIISIALITFCLQGFISAQTVSLDEVVTMIYNKKDISGQKVIIEDLYFDTGSAAISEASAKILKKISFVLHQIPTTQLRIEGHTDNVGNDDMNRQLSENRAKAVKEYLVSKQIFDNRLSYIGHGESVSIADNTTAQGRAINRRVQLVFESLDTRTHYILLTNGNEIPVIMVLVYEGYLEYKTSGDASFARIDRSEVEEVKFADGNSLPMRPVSDSDGDGIVDGNDNCPNEFGIAANNGCPEAKDTDGDNVLDIYDECPDEIGTAANNGCPESELIEQNNFWQDLFDGEAPLFEKAVGIRAANGYGISHFKINQDKNRFRELLGNYESRANGGEFQLTVLAGKIYTLKSFYWYWGGGIHVNVHDELNYVGGGIDGISGIGYNFRNIPLNISFDYKPTYDLYTTQYGLDPIWYLQDAYGLSLRYILN